jgi:hypothetical protein
MAPKINVIGPALAALLVLLAAALVGFPLYVHSDVVKATGAYAPLYLYEYSPYDTITVEAHYQADAVPSDAALDNLKGTLAMYTGKRVEIQKYGDLPDDAAPEQMGDDNVSAIGAGIIERYGHSSMGWLNGNIPIYILYVNASGPRTGDNDTVVGISYRADSFIVLENHIDSEGLEKAVLVHETGHLLGLEHDDDPNCVMVEVLLQKKAWGQGKGGPPTDFCTVHRQELDDRRHNPFYNMRSIATPANSTMTSVAQ